MDRVLPCALETVTVCTNSEAWRPEYGKRPQPDSRRRAWNSPLSAYQTPQQAGGADRWEISPDRHSHQQLHQQWPQSRLYLDAVLERQLAPTHRQHLQI